MDELAADALTCVVAFGSRVFAGDASGFVRCYAATSGLGDLNSGGGGGDSNENENDSSSRETERGSSNTAAAADGSVEVPLSTPEWVAHAAQGAILSLCVIRDPRVTSSRVTALKKNDDNGDGREDAAARRFENLLLLVGAASGELVFFRNETEVRRVQLESAVLQICARGPEAEFLAGDLCGTLYGVNQYGVLWKERVGDGGDVQEAFALNSQESNGGAFFYPPTVQPVFKAIASITVPDIENTLSSYVLLSTGQRHLTVTHQGKAFAYIPTSSPVSSIASFSPSASKEQEDVILFAGEAGKVYRISTSREPSFRFVVELWAEVSFPVAKILHVGNASSDGEDGDNSKRDSFTWVCLGLSGQVALFCGKNLIREWNAATSSLSNSSFPVDAAVISSRSSTSANLAKKESKMVAIAFPDRVQLFAVGS